MVTDERPLASEILLHEFRIIRCNRNSFEFLTIDFLRKSNWDDIMATQKIFDVQ